MKLQEKYKKIRNEPHALLATNFYNFETLRGILQAAAHCQSPIILQLSRASIEYLRLPISIKMARSAIREFGVEAWLHLDHGDSYELVAKCLDIGFDSVMIDASEESFQENIRKTQKVVKLAEKYDACVESELGYISKLGQSQQKVVFTKPEDAKIFVEETGVDALAIAIGSSHGFYKGIPSLDLVRLEKIKEMTEVALVLHGSSGIPNSMLKEVIGKGISKINLATEIKNAFVTALRDSLNNENGIDLRKTFPVAIQAVTKLVVEKLKVVNNIGREQD